ncbi:MAG: DUF302 domain-containing protein [Acidobacteria bacterium]|nr:DUF302 domain-containing protein [Acidobacteriota bacterium]
MLFEVTSTKSIAEIDQRLRDSAARQKFGVVAVHDLKDTMRNKGVEFAGECYIYEVCNPQQAKRVLEANGAVSTALPCRISVYQAGEGYKIATLLPTALMQMFNSPELEPVAKEVEGVIRRMVEDAA